MTQGDTVEQRHDYAALIVVVKDALGSLRARDGDIVLNTEWLKIVVDTTREIKEQLVLMNGRVRENEKDLAVAKANPTLTREHCDTLRGELNERLRAIEEKTPAIIQNLIIAFTAGGVAAIVGFLLSKLP